jgi:hypothetical protein
LSGFESSVVRALHSYGSSLDPMGEVVNRERVRSLEIEGVASDGRVGSMLVD